MLTEVRRKSGVTQRELALMTGLNQSTISKIERGQQRVDIETAFKISKALNADIKEVFSLPPVKKEEPQC